MIRHFLPSPVRDFTASPFSEENDQAAFILQTIRPKVNSHLGKTLSSLLFFPGKSPHLIIRCGLYYERMPAAKSATFAIPLLDDFKETLVLLAEDFKAHRVPFGIEKAEGASRFSFCFFLWGSIQGNRIGFLGKGI